MFSFPGSDTEKTNGRQSLRTVWQILRQYGIMEKHKINVSKYGIIYQVEEKIKKKPRKKPLKCIQVFKYVKKNINELNYNFCDVFLLSLHLLL